MLQKFPDLETWVYYKITISRDEDIYILHIKSMKQR